MRHFRLAQEKYTRYDKKNDMPLTFNDFITVSQLASLCKVTRRTVYRWLETGKAPSHETAPDDRIYFHRAEARVFAAAWRKKYKNTRKGLTAGKAPAHFEEL